MILLNKPSRNLYIIPGGGETTNRKVYKQLSTIAEANSYTVMPINPDWNKPISSQVFPISKNDTLFGFSRGAVLAYCVSQKYECEKVILASMTPLYMYSKNLLEKHYGKELAADFKKIKFKKVRKNEVYFYGEHELLRLPKIEKLPKNIKIVKGAEHELTDEYINQIEQELQ